jgi:NADP-dependent 3-hydroxy acid dehydrogenase YdfG
MSKIAVITGSSGGIGSALVRRFLNDAYFFIGLDRRASCRATLDSYTEMDVNLILFAKDVCYRKRILKDPKGYKGPFS